MHPKCAIYALKNLDGLASAAIIARYLNINKYHYKIEFFTHQNINQVLADMQTLEKHLIFIADISPNDIKNVQQTIRNIKKNNKIVFWAAKTCSNEILNDIKSQINNLDIFKELSTSEITKNRFLPKDQIAKELAEIGKDNKFAINKNENSKKISDLITFGYDEKELTNELSKGIFWSEKLETERNTYLAKKKKALEDLEKSKISHIHNAITITYALANKILSSAEAGEKILEDNKTDIAIILYKDGKITFRRKNNTNLNLIEIAKLFSGGGQQYASGGIINNQIQSKEKFEQSVDHVNSILRNFFTNQE